jgi:hypothetical protein
MTPRIYIQVGVTALRTLTGKHYPAIPLYVEADRLNASGLAPAEEAMLCDFAGFANGEYYKRLNEQKGANENDDITVQNGV